VRSPETLKYRILATDAAIIILATLVAFALRFGNEDGQQQLFGPIQIVGTLLPIFWLFPSPV
jgi:hypothetical protein